MIVKIDQKKQRIGILLQQHLGGGYMEAVAARTTWTNPQQLVYCINNFIQMPDTLTEDDARDYSEWLRLAASTLEMLKRTITSRADFDKQWQARMVARTVVLDEVEAVIV